MTADTDREARFAEIWERFQDRGDLRPDEVRWLLSEIDRLKAKLEGEDD